jgi:hypothetical protein
MDNTRGSPADAGSPLAEFLLSRCDKHIAFYGAIDPFPPFLLQDLPIKYRSIIILHSPFSHERTLKIAGVLPPGFGPTIRLLG